MEGSSGLGSLVPLLVGYAVCSSTLLVANKWALELFPKKNLLMFFQFFTSFAAVAAAWKMGFVQSDPLEWDKMRKFIIVVLIFYAVIIANMKSLEALGVDMTILFRSLTPFAISIGDYIYLGRALPSKQSLFSLFAMACCTGFIFVREPHLTWAGLSWGVVYYVILSVDMVYLKKITVDVKLTTNGRVIYTNLLASGPALIGAVLFGEIGDVSSYASGDKMVAWIAVGVTCLLGLGMSYISWALRPKVSALSFVVIGILCKIGSVVINALTLSQHLSPQSMALVCLGIVASTMYEQPKARAGQKDVNEGSKGAETGEVAVVEPPEPLTRKKVAMMVALMVAILSTQYLDKIFGSSEIVPEVSAGGGAAAPA
eukprot:CAMPEP_0198339596 /NCGR_PEP_ID=MMETSP1450-20131203/41036_1 /TAXON_ID=753684 ORGANISM="Madagascaria erythrocladiodes, Strain CCMP3234" /NCGR_SAMPLE_ID=MMETSP1450 /ASSEMBLY_ACC=CAM_ASM_001115 /LENGTH=370 /DNA_ID=CAMNT_0044044539 /DNA_START=79 /DNA_END=1191 /DNA_ORIENTATION=-